MSARVSGMDGFSEQGEWEFAAGTVKGYREWQLKFSRKMPELPLVPDKHLMGHWGGQWHGSDWQVARCDISETMAKLHESEVAMLPGGVKFWHPLSEIPTEQCGCGFWAFWEQSKSNHVRGPVDFSYPAFTLDGYWAEFSLRDKPAWVKAHLRGVGEGAGRTIIGEKGFRSQKMRMLAIAVVEPQPHPVFDTTVQRFLGKTSTEVVEELTRLVSEIAPGVPIVDDVEKLKEFM